MRLSFTSKTSRRAFTLVEVLVSAALMGLIIVALMVAMVSGTKVTEKTEDTTRACFLAGQIRELVLVLPFIDPDGDAAWGLEHGESVSYPFDDLDDLTGLTFSPPILSDGTVLSDLAGWSQAVTMRSVSPSDFDQEVTDGSSSVVKVTVLVKHGNEVSAELTWLAFELD